MSDLENLQAIANAHARLMPKYHGALAALDLERVAHKRTAVEAARFMAEAAALRLKVAEAELVLAEARSRRGDRSIPTTLEARPWRIWLDENGTDAEEHS